MKLSEEEIIQIQVCEWIKQLHPEIPIIGIMNQRKCSVIYGFILKRMGQRKGASDLFFPKGNAKYHGFFLELKTETGKLSKPQSEFMFEMREHGYQAQVAYGFDQAIQFISQFYEITS